MLFVLEKVLEHGLLLLAEERVALQGGAPPRVDDDEPAFDAWAAEQDGVPVSLRALVEASEGEDAPRSISFSDLVCAVDQMDDAFPALVWEVERILEGEPDRVRRA